MEQKIGNYKLLRLLGEGGMGAVYEGVHEAIERHVAIKVLHPEYARRPEFRAGFIKEPRAELGPARVLGVQHLDGYMALDRFMDAFVDRAHATLPEESQ